MLTEEPKVQIVEYLFNALFDKSEKTILVSGADEPLYLPSSSENEYNQIFSTSDYFSSALHEISHWCVAGATRRKLIDYGYWYEPDGRDVGQQAEFEKVEVKPQALERIMSCAAGMSFRLSADNASDPSCRPSQWFVDAVQRQTEMYVKDGLPLRAGRYIQALDARFTGSRSYAKLCSYVASDLL